MLVSLFALHHPENTVTYHQQHQVPPLLSKSQQTCLVSEKYMKLKKEKKKKEIAKVSTYVIIAVMQL